MTKKLSEGRVSKKYLEEKEGIKSKPITMNMKKKLEQSTEEANRKIISNNSIYNQSNAHSNETIVSERESHAKKFVDNIENMRNPHIGDWISLEEKFGLVEDYSKYQERKDLERYREFLNSSDYDFIKEADGPNWGQLLGSDIKDCRTCQNMSSRVEQNEKPIDDCLGYINQGHNNHNKRKQLVNINGDK